MIVRSAFLIGAAHSGSGKTLLTLGLLKALTRRGMDVQPFKCGPDFIDPTLHHLAAGRTSINLDLSMMGREGCLAAHARHAKGREAVVVEGVMGLFDGGSASSASLAHCLDLPVVLVIDVRSAAESVAAVIKGFELLDPRLTIAGVICNRVGSSRHRELIEAAVREHCTVPIVGFFPRDLDFTMPSRHLGLHMGHELQQHDEWLDRLADAIERNIDLEQLLRATTRGFEEHEPSRPRFAGSPCRLAVAKDEAFCFYYQENFDILRDLGFELIDFSPLHDPLLPAGVCGVYLGGGYPELHAEKLAANVSMRDSLRQFAEAGGFVYGECGGFMYMTRELIGLDGARFPMSGIFDIEVCMKDRLSRLGYRQPVLLEDCCLGKAGESFYGHEFHYSDIRYRNPDIDHLYTLAGQQEGCRRGNALGSYIHLHFAQSHAALKRLREMLHDHNEK